MLSQQERATITSYVDYMKSQVNDLENIMRLYRELTFRVEELGTSRLLVSATGKAFERLLEKDFESRRRRRLVVHEEELSRLFSFFGRGGVCHALAKDRYLHSLFFPVAVTFLDDWAVIVA